MLEYSDPAAANVNDQYEIGVQTENFETNVVERKCFFPT